MSRGAPTTRGPFSERHQGTKLPPEPFLAWLKVYFDTHPNETINSLSRASGINARRIRDYRRGNHHVSLRSLAKILDAAGEYPHTLHDLYPLDGSPPILPEAPRFRSFAQFCGFRGCREKPGHGDRGNFCREHAPVLERIRDEFAREDENWGQTAARRKARARRWGHLDLDFDDLEDAA